ncbi:MAG: hypothetical protein GXO22_06330 [Aquificae bacterium]|nr:hypothetical protein [Aquificota bacterium]
MKKKINPFYLIISIGFIGFLPFLFIFLDRVLMKHNLSTEAFFLLEMSILLIGAISVVIFVIFLTLK